MLGVVLLQFLFSDGIHELVELAKLLVYLAHQSLFQESRLPALNCSIFKNRPPTTHFVNLGLVHHFTSPALALNLLNIGLPF